jgi:4-aminobutyrate aminotransferase/(S)-3-amino-2-methylpropionate transaminase
MELVDVDGNRYLDFAAGFGSVLLGHGHPSLMRAVTAQAARLVQGLGDVYVSDVKIALMTELAALHPHGPAQVLLTQSGSDAIAAALKTATLATGRHAFVAFDGAYHGLGHGPLGACGFNEAFRAPFAPQLNQAISFCPYPGLRGASMGSATSMLEQWLRHRPVAAVLIEPVLGRGGCIVPPAGFVAEVCERAHAHGALVIADEIWTGLGRTGAMLRSETDRAMLDIVCLGKGLGGGLPISACIGTARAMHAWQAGDTIHTSTHAGAPLACAAALATLAVLREQRLADGARELGNRALARLCHELAGRREIVDIRGAGLMIGVELDSAERAQRAIRSLLRAGIIVLSGGIDGATLTLTPPLVVTDDHFAAFATALATALDSGI